LVTANIDQGKDFPTAVFDSIEQIKTADVDILVLRKHAQIHSQINDVLSNKKLDINSAIKTANAGLQNL
jgi:hypothetical protein